jgi:hypothetical protein
LKGGYMNKNTRKILALSIMSMFVFMLSVQVVSAAYGEPWTVSKNADGTTKNGVIHQPINNDHWLFSTIQFLGLGASWADFIVALAITLIIFAAAFDILNLTAFSTTWVKASISVGIAVVFGVTGGLGWFSFWAVKLAGGSVIIATFVAIILGAVTLVVGTKLKGQMRHIKTREDISKIQRAGSLAGAQNAVEIKKAKMAEKALDE